ncbi:MAG: hypothetical protein JW395_1254 [Nitrospira sp.]|nr:hypothetical protein [Nitrospira sp.]
MRALESVLASSARGTRIPGGQDVGVAGKILSVIDPDGCLAKFVRDRRFRPRLSDINAIVRFPQVGWPANLS